MEKIGYNFDEQEMILNNKKPFETIKDIKNNTKSLMSFFEDECAFKSGQNSFCKKVLHKICRLWHRLHQL